MTLLVEHACITSNNDHNPNPKSNPNNENNTINPNHNPNLTTRCQDTINVQDIVLLSPNIDKFVI